MTSENRTAEQSSALATTVTVINGPPAMQLVYVTTFGRVAKYRGPLYDVSVNYWGCK